jgi:hypothetical protein
MRVSSTDYRSDQQQPGARDCQVHPSGLISRPTAIVRLEADGRSE